MDTAFEQIIFQEKKKLWRNMFNNNKHSTSIDTSKEQINTIIKYHQTPIRMALSKWSKQQMLEKMYRKGNAHMLWARMQISIAIMEKSIKTF